MSMLIPQNNAVLGNPNIGNSRKSLGELIFMFLVLFIALMFAPVSALSQERPCPPLQLCIDGNCESSTNCGEGQSSKKWNPGFYMQLLRNEENLKQANRFTQYEEIADSAVLKGVMVPWRWSQLEGDKRGDYSSGIAEVRGELEKLKSLREPKRMIMKIVDFDYGSNTVSSNYFPGYLRQKGLTYVGTNGVGFCRWDDIAMSHYIDMVRAYAEAFDNDPFFEGIILYKETAAALGGANPCGYSLAKYATQTRRMLSAASAAFRRSNVVLAHNYFISKTESAKLIEFMADYDIAIGGPDVMPPVCTDNTDGTWAYQGFRGDSGGTDYRGVIASIWSVEVSEMGLGLGDCTPDQFVRFANDSLHASHLGIDRNTFAGGPENQWPAIIKYISNADNSLKNKGCPATYNGLCE